MNVIYEQFKQMQKKKQTILPLYIYVLWQVVVLVTIGTWGCVSLIVCLLLSAIMKWLIGVCKWYHRAYL